MNGNCGMLRGRTEVSGKKAHLTEREVSRRWGSDNLCRRGLLHAARAVLRATVQAANDVEGEEWMRQVLEVASRARMLSAVAGRLEQTAGCGKFSDDVRAMRVLCEGPVRVWHLSDLHFGKKHRRLPAVTKGGAEYPMGESLLSLCNRIEVTERPDVVVITGDMTWQADVMQKCLLSHGMDVGSWLPEFKVAREFLRKLADAMRPVRGISGRLRVVVVPGNHDIAWLGDQQPLATFRSALGKYCVTPYTAVRRRGGDGFRMGAVSRRDGDGVPVGAVTYEIRGIEIAFFTFVTDYFCGDVSLRCGTNVEVKARRQIDAIRKRVLDGGFSAVTVRETQRAMELIDAFGRSAPLVSVGYSDVSLEVLREMLDSTRGTHAVRLCVSHAPLVQVQGATGDVVTGGDPFMKAADLAFAKPAKAFHALLSGHLHSNVGGVRVLPGNVWIVSGGTVGARPDVDKLPTQSTNSFAELIIGDGNALLSHVPWDWENGTWVRQKGRRKVLVRGG